MNAHTINRHPHHSPRCKLRGKRCYFRRLRARASAFQLDVRAGGWWDMWHHHVDWPGWGNRGLSYRRPHVAALCEAFRKIAAQGPNFTTPFQAWILLSGENAGEDATYLHTPNPNGDSFPLQPADVNIGDTAFSPLLRSLLPEMQLHIGWSVFNSDDAAETVRSIHWVWAENVGTPLWTV